MKITGFNIFFWVIAANSILVCGSCQNSQPEILALNFEDLVVDTLFLEKSPKTKELGYDFKYFENDHKKVTLKTFVHRTLYEYSFPEGRIIRTQVYENEGPDGIGSFVQGFFIEREVIWFLSELELIKADHFGNVLGRFSLPQADNYRQSVNYSTIMEARIYREGQYLLIPDVPFVVNESVVKHENWVLRFNTEDQSFKYLSFQWPEMYSELLQDPKFGRYGNTFIPETGNSIISLPASDSLIVISDSGNKKVFAGVSEPMRFFRGEPSQQGEWIVFNSNQNSSIYSGIYWDYIEKILYRLATVVPDTEENKMEGKSPSTKMLLLDKAFNVFAEIDMPFDTGGFNTPQGFYFRIGYPRSEDEVAYVKLSYPNVLK